jgi:hypothetical protein
MADFEFQERDISIKPIIYAYRDKKHPEYGYKIGETQRASEVRIKEQQGVKKPGDDNNKIEAEYIVSAMRPDGSIFRDHDVHHMLENSFHCVCTGGEWYKCTLKQLNDAVIAVRDRKTTATVRTETCPTVSGTTGHHHSIDQYSSFASAMGPTMYGCLSL